MGGSGAADKIVDRAGLLAARSRARERGETVVLCHGCFDIVHPGHVRHLRQAREMGGVLVVSITGDAHISKGSGRPLIPQELRAENLAALDIVDHVHIDPSPTALGLLTELEPDVYIKGREYESNGDPRFRAEREAVEAAGGRVVFSSGDVIFSSSALIGSLEQAVDPSHARLSQLLADPALSAEAAAARIERFRGRRVTIVGDAIIDTYVLCDRPDVAGESPMLTLRPLETRRYDGGAAIIARHAAAMGASPTLVTALPDTPESDELVGRLRADGVEVLTLPVGGMLPEKQRFVVGTQKVVKVDLVRPLVLDAGQRDALVGLVAAAPRPDAAIIADFGLGVLTTRSIETLARELRKRGAFLAGDISGRRGDLLAMRGLDLVTPSESELRESMRLPDEALPAVISRFARGSGSQRAIVTMGPEGAVGFEPLPDELVSGDAFATRLKAEHVPALTPTAIDALGCGDALLAAATLCMASGGSMLEATFLGSVAAAAQARRFGNVPVSATDLRRGVAGLHAANLAFAPADEIEGRARARQAS
ncbi:MAG: PfkB family carbohydrate kinase [Planctomycetota bacterium]